MNNCFFLEVHYNSSLNHIIANKMKILKNHTFLSLPENPLSLSLSLYIYVYIYAHTHICICICIWYWYFFFILKKVTFVIIDWNYLINKLFSNISLINLNYDRKFNKKKTNDNSSFWPLCMNLNFKYLLTFLWNLCNLKKKKKLL